MPAVRMASSGEDLSDSSPGSGERHGSPDDAHVRHGAQPGRISLSSIFSRKPAKGGARPAASRGTKFGGECHKQSSPRAAAMGTSPRRLRKDQTSTLLEFLPLDAAEVQEWHPNRILAAVVQFVASRVDESNTSTCRRRQRTKDFVPLVTVRAWARRPEVAPAAGAGSWEQRSCGKRFFIKVMRIACGQSQRAVQARAAVMWKQLSHEDMFQWAQLVRIVKHRLVAPHIQELSENHRTRPDVPQGPPRQKQPRTVKGDTEEVSQKSGYGFVGTYNTSLGQDDPEVIKIVQSGATGPILRAEMRRLAVYVDAFESLWLFATTLANKYHFATVNVTLEHSEHGDHHARVHFHFFIGIDLSGGMGFVQTPTLRTIPYHEFQWQGIRPHISPTITNRKSWGAIYQAVATGAYYVAGPKTSVIMKRSTCEPIEDHIVQKPGRCVKQHLAVLSGKGGDVADLMGLV